jgi:hypothetical protein
MHRLHAAERKSDEAAGTAFPEGFVAVTAARIVTYLRSHGQPVVLNICKTDAMELRP